MSFIFWTLVVIVLVVLAVTVMAHEAALRYQRERLAELNRDLDEAVRLASIRRIYPQRRAE